MTDLGYDTSYRSDPSPSPSLGALVSSPPIARIAAAFRPSLPRPEIGELAPDITLLDRDGQPWRLRDQTGGAVVLIFHRHIH